MNDRVDRILDRAAIATSIALVAVFLGTLATVAWPRAMAALGVGPRPPAPAYRAGAKIDTPVEWHQAAPITLFLFARSSCGACQTARPFLQQLVATAAGRTGVVLVTSAEEHDVDAQFGREIGLPAGAIKPAVPGLRVRVTPTLVLVDREGTILDAWEGVGPAERQAEIAKRFEQLAGSL